MKRFCFVLLFVLIFFSGCSVQAKMSPQILINRLSDKCESFYFENAESFIDNTDFIYYVKTKNSIDYIFIISVNQSGDVKKISLSCSNTEKAENLICNIRDIVSVYSPDQNSDEIIKNLTISGKLKKGMNCHENQWYLYCVSDDENGMYFSVTNKKLFPRTSVEYSLKPNDKYDF